MNKMRFRVVRFRHEAHSTQQPMSHVEIDADGEWRRLTFHVPDATAELICAMLNHAAAEQVSS